MSYVIGVSVDSAGQPVHHRLGGEPPPRSRRHHDRRPSIPRPAASALCIPRPVPHETACHVCGRHHGNPDERRPGHVLYQDWKFLSTGPIALPVSTACCLRNQGATLTYNSTTGTYTFTAQADDDSYTYSAPGVITGESNQAGSAVTVEERHPGPRIWAVPVIGVQLRDSRGSRAGPSPVA